MNSSSKKNLAIGIDFDNTIVFYDDVIVEIAHDLYSIPQTVAPTKLGIRDYLRETNREEDWIKLQGLIYGKFIYKATPFLNVICFLKFLSKFEWVSVFIISHKTEFPFSGPKFNLHHAASNWIQRNLKIGDKSLIHHDNIFFEETKNGKIARINEVKCDYFIDDLPEICLHNKLEKTVHPILFDSSNILENIPVERFTTWDQLKKHFAYLIKES